MVAEIHSGGPTQLAAVEGAAVAGSRGSWGEQQLQLKSMWCTVVAIHIAVAGAAGVTVHMAEVVADSGLQVARLPQHAWN